MRTTMQLFTRGVFMTLIVFLTALGTSKGQATYTMSTANCTTTANSFEFDVMVTNTNASTDLRMNGTVIRGTLSSSIIAAGTNTIAFSYVNDGQSIIPNSFPPNSIITFTYNATSRLFQVSTLNTVYNNNTCTAPLVAPGTTAKIGRFRLANSTNNFVPGAIATFVWNTTSSIIAYEGCSTTTSLTLAKTLATPCSVAIPSAGCTMTASIASQINVLCFGGSTGSATATTANAPGAVTYSWNTSPVQTGATASGLAAGSYIVTATSGACTASATVTITGPASGLTASSSQDSPILCNGGSTTVTVSASGGTGPYTGTGSFSATAGSHTYTVTDVNGCSTTTSVTLSEPAALSASSSATAIACNGGSATVTVSATGGSVPYTGTGSFTVGAGSYTYTVTDANGCSSTTSITVSQPDALSATATATNASCPSCTDGTVSVATVTGGTAPYSYDNLTGLGAGNYCITVTDANGCTTQACATVGSTACSIVASSSQGSAILCNGGTTTVTVSQTGGALPVTGTGTFTVGAGSYTYTVTDNNGCSSTTSITVSEPSALSAASSQGAAILCNGGTTTVTVSATGGTAPYTGTGSVSVGAGSYTYTVTDANGCTATTSITVAQPSALSASSSSTAILCNGGSATVTVSATGGTAPYSGTGSFSVGAGSYTYTVTDANGCSSTTSITVTEPSSLSASSSQGSAILCNGGSATVTVSATGGTAPYSGTGSFSVGAGSYTYTVTDANGCSSTTSITVSQPDALSATATATNASCPSCTDGTVSVATVTGGTAPYSYDNLTDLGAGTYCVTVTDANGCTTQACATVGSTACSIVASSSQGSAILCNGGTTTVTVSQTGGALPVTGTGTFTVGAGTYTYTVTDNNGCSSTTSITVTEPTALSASSSATAILCNGGSATVTVSATGGTAPYSGTGSFTVGAGSYTYTVTDNNGCSSTTSITVIEPSALSASSSATAIACNGGSATVTVSATGGTGPYSGTGSFTVGAGSYTYTVTDNNGCSSTTSITVTEPAALSASSSSTAILCNGGSATVTVSATGGTAPYSGTGSFSVGAGSYTYTVTDANGCSSTTSITVTQPATLSASSSSTAILCNGGSATVTVSATGGTAPYSGTGSFTEGAGSYTYTVTDANGCSSTTSITVTEPAVLSASSSATAILCNGGSATVTVSATGGTAPYSGTGSFSVGAGSYTYTVTDANGCSSITSITVNEPSALSASASASGTIACFGGTTIVNVSATGGTSPYSGTGSFPQGAGTSVYTVTDGNGCVSTASVTLTAPTKVEGTTSSTPSSGCSVADGTATVSPFGGTPGYTVLWSNGQTSLTATGLIAGVYTVSITDANGCSGSATVTVSGLGGSVNTPGAISGPEGACRNTTGIVYSVAPVLGATDYTWTLPSGATGSSTTNSITVSFGSTYAGGFICVTANNACGSSLPSCMNIPVITAYPALPAVISGPSVTCGAGTYTFSTTSANATSYNWTVTGTGVTIQSGQGTSSITISVPAGFAQGSVQVRGVNCNGTSAVRGMTITGIPAHSNAVSGPSLVCANNSATYTMPVVPGVSTYAWSITGNATLASQSLTSTTSSATFNFGPSWTSGVVTISVSNICGAYTRTFTVGSTPNQPGAISGPGTALCNQSNVTYSIAAVPGATSYSWSVPVGASLVSTAPNGLSIVVNFTPAFTGNGDICVAANNLCGTGRVRCFAVTARPGVPVITGPSSACKTQSSVAYNIAPVTGATSYTWSVTGGPSINPLGNTAVVNFNTALSSAVTVRANANNACGSSQPGALGVTVNLFCRTAADVDGSDNSTEFGVYPNPTSTKTTISFNAVSEMKYIVKVVDLLGNSVYVKVINASENYNSAEIDMTNFAKGVYMISLTAEDGNTQTKRIIVE